MTKAQELIKHSGLWSEVAQLGGKAKAGFAQAGKAGKNIVNGGAIKDEWNNMGRGGKIATGIIGAGTVGTLGLAGKGLLGGGNQRGRNQRYGGL